MRFATFIKTHRIRLDLTQAELAELITLYGYNTSPQRVGHWETERNDPPMNNPFFRAALAQAIRMDINHIMTELGFTVDESDRSHEALLAAEIVDRLPPPAKQLAIDYLEVLQKRFSA